MKANPEMTQMGESADGDVSAVSGLCVSSGEDRPHSAHTGGTKEWNHPLELKDVGRDGGKERRAVSLQAQP